MDLKSEDDAVVPGYRNYRIFCDESCITKHAYWAFGSLWIPHERRGDLTGLVAKLQKQHGLLDEVKWQKTNKRTLPLYVDLVDAFFQRPWMMFHALVVRNTQIRREQHGGDLDIVRRKLFSRFLAKKIASFADGCADKCYHLRLDRFASRYAKADEAAHVIINNEINRQLGTRPLTTTRTVDSKGSVGVQLADLLVGALTSAWNYEDGEIGEPKQQLRRHVAACVGWEDLRHDTWPAHVDPLSWKYNIWMFCDPRFREVQTLRRLRFRFPVRPYVRRPARTAA